LPGHDYARFLGDVDVRAHTAVADFHIVAVDFRIVAVASVDIVVHEVFLVRGEVGHVNVREEHLA